MPHRHDTIPQTATGGIDDQPIRFDCSACGAPHDGVPSFGWEYPAPYLGIPESERSARVILTDDSCVIDDTWYFIRGCLEIPVVGHAEPLTYGVWLSLSAVSFARYVASFDTVGRAAGVRYFGWLCTAIPGYPDTQLLKTSVVVRPWPTRPAVELEPSDHPLAIEQRDGIAAWRVRQIIERIAHARHHDAACP